MDTSLSLTLRDKAFGLSGGLRSLIALLVYSRHCLVSADAPFQHCHFTLSYPQLGPDQEQSRHEDIWRGQLSPSEGSASPGRSLSSGYPSWSIVLSSFFSSWTQSGLLNSPLCLWCNKLYQNWRRQIREQCWVPPIFSTCCK